MADVSITYKGAEIASMSATGTKTLLTEAKYCEDDITVAYTKPSAPAPSLQSKTNISPTTSSQTITADEGYDGLSSVQINAVSAGTAGTPTATKGAVSGNAVSVTPSVTNTTGYITGGTISGTAVSVAASELVSGTINITQNGTVDVTNYASASVSVSGGTSSYTLVKSLEEAVSTSSTTASIITNFGYTFDASKMYLITVRDKAGPRNGYFYGTDTVFLPVASGTLNRYAVRRTYSYASNTMTVYVTTNGLHTGQYGVYPDEIAASTGSMNVRARYNATNSLTIDGTYIINAYEIAYPSGVPAPL